MSAPKPGSAQPTVQVDNGRVRVTKWTFPGRGDNTGWHRHEHDYVVVPLLDGRLRIDQGGGNFTASDLEAGKPYFREKGVEHDVISDNDREYAFVEIEITG